MGYEKAVSGYYRNGDKLWSVQTLIKACEGLPVMLVPVDAIDLGAWPWGSKMSLDKFAEHMMRAMDCDLRYPIIFDDVGYIADGWHRLAKALVTGRKKIRGVRLRVMPDPDKIVECVEDDKND
jgi:hypothetical protein